MRPAILWRTASLLAAVLAVGQQTAPLPSDVVIRSNTRLVEIHVFAQDSQGRSVPDLQQKDFQVLDNGKAQPLTLFSADRSTGTPAAAAPPPDPDRPAEPAADRTRYSLILLDWLNTTYTDRIFANDKVAQLFKRHQPHEKVALAALDRQWRMLSEFTSDPAELLAGVRDPDLQADATLSASVGTFDARSSGRPAPGATVEQQIFDLDNKVHDTLRALDEVAVELSRLPGRKSLVWVTNAFPLVIDGSVVRGAKPLDVVYVQELDRLLARLNAANVAVYTIDARGLPASAGPGWVDTMRELSARTGGTAFYARNDLDEGLRLALDDTLVSYTLGFLAPEDAAPGMHTLKVRVKRAGVLLRYRAAYRVEEPPKEK